MGRTRVCWEASRSHAGEAKRDSYEENPRLREYSEERKLGRWHRGNLNPPMARLKCHSRLWSIPTVADKKPVTLVNGKRGAYVHTAHRSNRW